MTLLMLGRLASGMFGVCRTDGGRTGGLPSTKGRHLGSGRSRSRLNIVGLLNRISGVATSAEQRLITKDGRIVINDYVRSVGNGEEGGK
jgi:hypothetical protein